jgi:hypothetical protein
MTRQLIMYGVVADKINPRWRLKWPPKKEPTTNYRWFCHYSINVVIVTKHGSRCLFISTLHRHWIIIMQLSGFQGWRSKVKLFAVSNAYTLKVQYCKPLFYINFILTINTHLMETCDIHYELFIYECTMTP